MQRRLLIGGVACLLLFGLGLSAAYHLYKQSRPHPVWVPIPINPKVSMSEADRVIADLTFKISEHDRLVRLGTGLGLKDKWEMNSYDEVADEIAKRLYVRSGDMDTPMGKLPAIHVGVRGTNRDRVDSYALVEGLMPDVWKILGLDPPPQR
jgi:hypothetical protein